MKICLTTGGRRALLAGLLLVGFSANAQVWESLLLGVHWDVINGYGGWDNAMSRFRGYIDTVNGAHSRSGTGVQLSISGYWGEGAIPGSQDTNTALNMLTYGGEGDQIRSFGRQVYADLVTLMYHLGCDISSLGFQPGMYSLEVDCGGGTAPFIYGHEVGHNLNGDHDTGFCLTGSWHGNISSIMKTPYCGAGFNLVPWYSGQNAASNYGEPYYTNHDNAQRIFNQRWEVWSRRVPSGTFWGGGNDYRIIPQNANWKALDVPGRSQSAGTQLQIWDWNGTVAQIIFAQDQGNGWFKFMLSYNGNLVLDVQNAGAWNGVPVQIWWDNGTWAQRWVPQDQGNGYKMISAIWGGGALDVSGSGTSNGTKVQLWSDNGTLAQRWRFDKCAKFAYEGN